MSSEKTVLIEIQYLPPVEFFSVWKSSGKMVIEQFEHYSKRSYRNRTHIAGANGIAHLSIPLKKGKNEQQPIRETKIAWFESWARKHWQTIRSAYGNAPYFDYYSDELQPFFEKKYEFLFDWNYQLLLTLQRLLQIEQPLELSQAYLKEIPAEVLDMRNKISPKSKNISTPFVPKTYPQVFMEKNGFLPNLSILDLLFCTGPEAVMYL